MNLIEKKIKKGWGLQKVFNYLRKKEKYSEIRNITLYEVLVKEFSKTGKRFSRNEIVDNFQRLVSNTDYKRGLKQESINCIMELSNMYYRNV